MAGTAPACRAPPAGPSLRQPTLETTTCRGGLPGVSQGELAKGTEYSLGRGLKTLIIGGAQKIEDLNPLRFLAEVGALSKQEWKGETETGREPHSWGEDWTVQKQG